MLWNCRLDPRVEIQFQCREIQKVWICHQAWLGECLQHAHLWQSDYHRTSNLKKQISTKIKKIHDCELKSAFWCIVYLVFLRYQLISAHMLPWHLRYHLNSARMLPWHILIICIIEDPACICAKLGNPAWLDKTI